MSTYYKCQKCGWEGFVNCRPRCLACYRRRIKEWRKNNPERAKQQRARYNKRFKEFRRDEFNKKRRRLRKPETNHKQYKKRIEWFLSGNVTRTDLIEIYERDKVCVYCGTKVIPRFNPLDPRGFDHVISRANGGIHEKSNIVVCCRRCNELKK